MKIEELKELIQDGGNICDEKGYLSQLGASLADLAPEILALVQDCHEARLFGDHHAMLDALDAFNTKLAQL